MTIIEYFKYEFACIYICIIHLYMEFHLVLKKNCQLIVLYYDIFYIYIPFL